MVAESAELCAKRHQPKGLAINLPRARGEWQSPRSLLTGGSEWELQQGQGRQGKAQG